MISKELFKKELDLVMFQTDKNQEELAIEMGYGKNYISEMLTPTGKVTSKFISRFKTKYKDILENPNYRVNVKNVKEVPLSGVSHVSINDYIELLKEKLEDSKKREEELIKDKEWLKRNFEFSLAGLAVGQKSILAHVDVILDQDALRDSKGNADRAAGLREATDRRIREKLEGSTQKDKTPSVEGM